MMTMQYWFMFPVAIMIATIAMASGVGGATFFSPLQVVISFNLFKTVGKI